jgi:putative ABC transport system permease protein
VSPRRLLHLIRLSLQSVFLHRLRSTLTMLGIVLGVGSVIVMLAVGEAARFEAVRQIQELGASNVIVRSVKPLEKKHSPGDDDSLILNYGLTKADMQRIAETIPTVVSVTPVREFPMDVRYHDRKIEARMVSVRPDFEGLNRLRLARGRFITGRDNEEFANVVVLGADVAERLFPVEDPVGKSVRITEQQYFRVVGVTERKAATTGTGTSVGGQDYNRDVYVPFETDRARFGPTLIQFKSGNVKLEKIEISQLTVVVDRMENVKKTAEVIGLTLDQYHPDKDTELTVPLDLIEQAERAQRVFTMVLGAIAGISLLVGGIGVMNIMLATVTERTREIGIRRALGAKRRDIAWQFLVETLTLSSAGGLLGVGVGVALALLVTNRFGFPTILRTWSVLLAFGVSLVVGLVFGTYPAYRAAQLDPIEALRHE